METSTDDKCFFSSEITDGFVMRFLARSKKGVIIHVKTRRELKPRINCKTGYCQVNICDKSLEKPKNYYCHRCIWESIKGEIPNNLEINHVNEIKSYNRL